jgi:hypothetical protein
VRDDQRDFEQRIERLGAAIVYPATPDLPARVLDRMQASSARSIPPAPAGWRFAGVALAAVVVGFAALVAIAAPARNAVADLFDRIEIFQADDVPEDLPSDIRGEEVSLAEAEERFGAPLVLPTAADGSRLDPSTVIYQDFSPSSTQAVAATFETDEGVPYVVVQTDGGLGKGLADGATAEVVGGVGDGGAYWLEGLRIVQLYDTDGNFLHDSRRRADANTLVWIEDSRVLRLEGDLSREEAIEIAKSVR